MKQTNSIIYNLVSAVLIIAFCTLEVLFHVFDLNFGDPIRGNYSISIAGEAVFLFFVVVALWGVSKIILFKRKPANFVVLIDTVLFTFIFVELIFSGYHNLTSSPDIFIVTKDILRPDTITGYRYLPGEKKQAYFSNSQTVFETTFNINSSGYPSLSNFQKTKNTTGKRYLVLGDSFSAETYNGTNWADELNKEMGKDSANGSEFYSFSLEGIGVPTWYNMFFKEIVPGYEFDAVILPIYFEDLNRPHVVMREKDNTVQCVFTETLPPNNVPALDYAFSNSMTLAVTTTAENFSRTKDSLRHIRKNFTDFKFTLTDNYLTPALAKVITHFNHYNSAAEMPTERAIDIVLGGERGKENLQILGEIIAYCKKDHKQIIICSVPDNMVVDVSNANCEVNEDKLIAALAKHFDVPFFSGYKCFSNVPASEVKQYFHPDGHWNRQGSHIFASGLKRYLEKVN